MKSSSGKLFFLFFSLTLTTSMFAQENPSKKPAKEIAEGSSNSDHIHAKKIQQKQLHAAPEILTPADSVKKSPAKKKKTK